MINFKPLVSSAIKASSNSEAVAFKTACRDILFKQQTLLIKRIIKPVFNASLNAQLATPKHTVSLAPLSFTSIKEAV